MNIAMLINRFRKVGCNKTIAILFLAILLFSTGCEPSSNPPTPAETISPVTYPTITEASEPAKMSESTLTPVPFLPTPMPGFDELVRMFDYDRTATLDLRWVSETTEDGAILHRITFLGADSCLIPAYLVTPVGDGPYPAVIYMHAGQKNKDQFLDEAKILARKGVVSLLFDSPFLRGCGDVENPRQGYIRTVIDFRRGVDMLELIPGVDSTRIGFVGHSFGATWGGVLAGIETRIKAYILIAGSAQISRSDSPEVPDLDAVLYIGHAQGEAFLFQFSFQDNFISEEDAKLYFNTAPEPKQIIWYDSTHLGLSSVGQEDRLVWLSEQLGFSYP